jgi:hypothetical protein
VSIIIIIIILDQEYYCFIVYQVRIWKEDEGTRKVCRAREESGRRRHHCGQEGEGV